MRIDDELAISLVDPKAYANPASQDAVFTKLRAENPLGRVELEGFDPFWAVTKHADILDVSRQNALFHNGDLSTVLTSKEADAKVRLQTGGSPHLIRSLVQMDAPDHQNFRMLTQSWFMPQNLKKLEDSTRKLAKKYVDQMQDMGGECDFVSDVALYFPLRVIMDILGVPDVDEPRMLKLTQELFGAQDPELNRGGGQPQTADEALAEMQAVIFDYFMYFNAITNDRRANPREDVATVIANGVIDGKPIGEIEAMGYYIIVAAAGHDTTSSSTAGGMLGLCENPDQFARLKANPAGIPGLVEESIRWTTPVQHFMRSATEDTVLRGQKIAKGDWLMLCYKSGNRDEEVFEDPFSFRSDRSPNKHLAFGYGAHLCLGQHLAKMEMRILWEELLSRLKSVERNGPMKMTQSSFVGGPKSLPIRYTFN